MNNIKPLSPDPYLKDDADMALARLGHVNAVLNASVHLLAKKSVNLNIASDTEFNFDGGSLFLITDVIITNASTVPASVAHNPRLYSQANQGGDVIAAVNEFSLLQNLITPENYVNKDTIWSDSLAAGFYFTGIAAQPKVYFNIDQANGSALTADVYIYGTVLKP